MFKNIIYNNSMTTTEVTTQSWFSRIGSSIKNVFIGILFVLGSIVFLFWNEGNAVKTEQSLKEGASAVVSVSSQTKDSANEGKLIHFSGMAQAPNMLLDSDFGISTPAIKLKRTVEVYQWKEDVKTTTKEKFGGGTETTKTYSYSKDWSDSTIDSSRFKESETHTNPSAKVFENKEWIAAPVTIGAYEIPEKLLQTLSGYQTFTVTPDMLATLPYDVQEKIELMGNMIYFQTDDPTMPQVGNTRIRYEVIIPQEMSVIAKQSSSSVVPYVTSNGRTISIIQTGIHTADEMFKGALSGNKTMTWVFRILGTLIMYIGLRMTLGVTPVIAGFVPFIGRIVGVGMSIASGLMTAIGASITIAIAWIMYRPLLAIGLLTVAAGSVIFLLRASSSKKK